MRCGEAIRSELACGSFEGERASLLRRTVSVPVEVARWQACASPSSSEARRWCACWRALAV